MPRLDNWFLFCSPEDVFENRRAMYGTVKRDPRFEDGKTIRTSFLVRASEKMGMVETRNTKYELGDPSEDYEQAYPDARARLIAASP